MTPLALTAFSIESSIASDPMDTKHRKNDIFFVKRTKSCVYFAFIDENGDFHQIHQ